MRPSVHPAPLPPRSGLPHPGSGCRGETGIRWTQAGVEESWQTHHLAQMVPCSLLMAGSSRERDSTSARSSSRMLHDVNTGPRGSARMVSGKATHDSNTREGGWLGGARRVPLRRNPPPGPKSTRRKGRNRRKVGCAFFRSARHSRPLRWPPPTCPRPRPHGSRRDLMGRPCSASPNAASPPAGFEVAGEFWIGARPPAARGDFGRQAQTDHTGERRNPNSFDIAQENEYPILPGPSSLGPTFPRLSSLHPILPVFPPETFPCERLGTTCKNTESSRRRWP
jgi:hypothetical protein